MARNIASLTKQKQHNVIIKSADTIWDGTKKKFEEMQIDYDRKVSSYMNSTKEQHLLQKVDCIPKLKEAGIFKKFMYNDLLHPQNEILAA